MRCWNGVSSWKRWSIEVIHEEKCSARQTRLSAVTEYVFSGSSFLFRWWDTGSCLRGHDGVIARSYGAPDVRYPRPMEDRATVGVPTVANEQAGASRPFILLQVCDGCVPSSRRHGNRRACVP